METETTLTNLTIAKRKVDGLFAQQNICLADIESLTKIELDYLKEIATERLHRLEGEERDNFISKIELIIPTDTKNRLWEHNHLVIGNAISRAIREYGYMPTKSAIAQETGLSRQTVNKHMVEYKTHPEFAAEMEQLKFMVPRILTNVIRVANNGDVKAARLYFEVVGALNKQQPNTVVNKQNNYIQINNTILSQEKLQQLSAEQLDMIESIVTNQAL